MKYMYDLAIIGGGPGGYVAAERAGAKGLKVVLIEKKALGGVCLNEGCIPTKTLLYSAKLYDNAFGGVKYGIEAKEVGFDFSKMMSRKQKVVNKLVGGVGAKMKMFKVKTIHDKAIIKGRTQQGIEITTSQEDIIASNLLICTGSEAFIPPIPGLDNLSDVILTNREILQLKQRPASLVIIGGGVIGMEFASFFNSLGAKVTVVEMMDEILGGMDVELSGMLRQMYAKKGIEFNLQSKVTKVDGNHVTFQKDGTVHTVSAEKILVSVGRKPVIEGYGLENLNIELHKGGIKVDEKMRTNIPMCMRLVT
ncbi:dihydrolipoyl dehydrogenase [Saccharicrinis fermentans DSM 9555 = JCM 21142]|uniref:Dihydrolipoamide dehydrogenase n=2 Tax=Saccharicrinis fermentans TaxID=982 RepID=W7Y1Y2_9BACT|nr:dihydrolipoyl dehydrogenase [Saccharicrinis fermentans DSM 9555 = JCM 21142]